MVATLARWYRHGLGGAEPDTEWPDDPPTLGIRDSPPTVPRSRRGSVPAAAPRGSGVDGPLRRSWSIRAGVPADPYLRHTDRALLAPLPTVARRRIEQCAHTAAVGRQAAGIDRR